MGEVYLAERLARATPVRVHHQDETPEGLLHVRCGSGFRVLGFRGPGFRD